MRQQEPETTEWRVNAETLYAAGYIFYGRVPELGEVAPWGRGRRPEDEAGPAAWVEVAVYLAVIGSYFLCVLPDYLAGGVNSAEPAAAAALALLPTCRPIAHGPPMCYEWERPVMAPPAGNGSGDSDRSHDDDKNALIMECFSGLVRDTSMTTGTALALLPTCVPAAHAPTMCYKWERPDMAPPPGSGSGDSDWSDLDDEKAAMECFYGLVRDATRTCDEWERRTVAQPGNGSGDSDWSGNDNKFTMECFYALAHDAAKTCFGWSYDTVRPDGHGNADPPPT